MVYNVLNRLKWTGKLKDCEVVILHRGAEGDRKTIKGRNIGEVKKGHFLYGDGKETHIPYHRVLEVRAGGKVVWKRRSV